MNEVEKVARDLALAYTLRELEEGKIATEPGVEHADLARQFSSNYQSLRVFLSRELHGVQGF